MSGIALTALAEAAGIAPRYWDIEGRLHEATPETLRALLEAFAIPAANDKDIAESLHLQRERRWLEILPPVYVMHEGETAGVPVCTPANATKQAKWAIVLEGDEVLEGVCDMPLLPVETAGEAGGVMVARRRLALPSLPPGYHRLRLDDCETETLLIVAPASCYLPDWWPGRRCWGIAAQLYALRRAGDWGIGDFSSLRALVDGANGADAVGLNPLHALFRDAPNAASPYSPASRLFCNPLYLDIEAVAEFAEMGIAPPLQQASEFVDYNSVAAAKYNALERMFSIFQGRHLAAGDARAAVFHAFVAEGGETLRKFAIFEALCESFGHHDWRNWPLWAQHPKSPGVAAFADSRAARIAFSQYVQWQCRVQLDGAAACAREKMAIGLYGDLAVSVDASSADHWAERDVFAGAARIGAPPDPFNEQGQEWGVVPFAPAALRTNHYAQVVALFRAAMRDMGALRVDHVMGWQRLFLIPAGAKASEGAYVRYPMEDFLAIAALESHRNRCLLIGEDLGTVPEGFRERMAAAQVLSCRVLYFERGGRQFRRPSEFPVLAAVSATTHDLATLRGFWAGEDIAAKARLGLLDLDEAAHARKMRTEDRQLLLQALDSEELLPAGCNPADADAAFTPALAAAIHAYLARTPSLLFVAQLDDLAGELHQTNLPGTTEGYPNWRRRLPRTLEDLLGDPSLREAMAAITRQRGS